MDMRYCAVLLVALSAVAAADGPAEIVLPHRTTLTVQLDTNIKTSRAQAGDPVQATLVTPVVLRGVVVIPKGARLNGSVVLARAHADGVSSRLIVRLDEAKWPGGAVKLNAFIARQVIEKRVIVAERDEGCVPGVGTSIGSPPSTPRAITPQTPLGGCPQGTVGQRDEEKTELVTPAMKDISVRRSADFPHAIELFSTKKDIDLPRGMLLELRHLAPPQ